MSKKLIARTIKERWKTERVYEELKGDLGFDHYEGRSFIGWHHHVSAVLCCYAFIVAERVRAFPPSAHGPVDTVRSPARPERHFADSFATLRLAIARVLARWLPRRDTVVYRSPDEIVRPVARAARKGVQAERPSRGRICHATATPVPPTCPLGSLSHCARKGRPEFQSVHEGSGLGRRADLLAKGVWARQAPPRLSRADAGYGEGDPARVPRCVPRVRRRR